MRGGLAVSGALMLISMSTALAQPVDSGAPSATAELLLNGTSDFPNYEAQVVEVVDAETIRLEIHIWPGRILTANVSARGIETPDRGSPACSLQVTRAQAARSSTRRNFPPGTWVYVNDVESIGGRLFADIVRWNETVFQSVTELLLSRHGQWAVRSVALGPTHDWCDE